MNTFKRHGFFWVMLGLLAISITIHWVTAWNAMRQEEAEHGEQLDTITYLNEVIRQMFENIQSEIIQLILQIGLIAYFWFVGSPSSKSEEERAEAKLDWIAEQLNRVEYSKLKKELEKEYPKK